MIDPDFTSDSEALPVPVRRRTWWLDLRENLAMGLRAATFHRVRADDFHVTATQIVVLVLIGLGLQLAFAVVRVGLDGSFDLADLPRSLVYVPLLLFAAWLIAQRERRPELVAAVPVLFCAASLPYDLGFEALDAVIRYGWLGADGYDGLGGWLWDGLYALWLGAMIVGIARLAGSSWLRIPFNAAVLVVIVALPLWHLPSATLWEAREAGEDEAVDWYALSREETFYAQPEILEHTLADLLPERPGVADLYFVGVAGYASEDVFMKEMAVIGDLFRSRFDAQGRSVLLVNNPKTVYKLPVATATALARTLKHIGRVMNTEEDILFLYVTTHGSEDHRLAIQFWPLQLHDIDPAMLRAMLDAAGIKWRVVVISACYSGGFLDALKNERTLVVTAAAATRQSFGCGSQSEFTYFGKAYFDEALRGTYSFKTAFDQARAAIDTRERAEGQSPSDPQLYLGAAMEQKLVQYSQRLQVLGPRRAVTAPTAGATRATPACSTCD